MISDTEKRMSNPNMQKALDRITRELATLVIRSPSPTTGKVAKANKRIEKMRRSIIKLWEQP